jgi:hypothetical protein
MYVYRYICVYKCIYVYVCAYVSAQSHCIVVHSTVLHSCRGQLRRVELVDEHLCVGAQTQQIQFEELVLEGAEAINHRLCVLFIVC